MICVRNDLNDALKNVLPKIEIDAPLTRSDVPDLSSRLDDLDPDSFSPNRTAKSAEHIEQLMEESAELSKRAFKFTRIGLVVSIIAAAAAVTGVILQLG